MNSKLKRFASIDIETTGVDAASDAIIDLGMMVVEQGHLQESFTSLIRHTGELSLFIQTLTGIRPEQLVRAPELATVLIKVRELGVKTLLAHNARFEANFLRAHLGEEVEFVDSLALLALLFPWRERLGLEGFIVDFALAESEEHRGLADARDLLKVVVLSLLFNRRLNPFWHERVRAQLTAERMEAHLYGQLLALSEDELLALALDLGMAPAQVQAHLEAFWQVTPQVVAGPATNSATSAQIKSRQGQLSRETIHEILQDETAIQATVPSYHYRASQVELACRTGQAFKHQVHAVIQAPTGTGKTLGYLVPAALYARQSGNKVLVATGTKTLQHQAVQKDIPQLKKILAPWGLGDLKTTLLMGSGNHLCQLKFERFLNSDEQKWAGGLFGASVDEGTRLARLYLQLLFHYNAEVTYAHKLTRDHLPYALKSACEALAEMESECAVDFRTCLGNRCPFVQACSYVQGLREAKEAELILGNHALMFVWPNSFERPATVVVDESHRLEDETTAHFTRVFSSESLKRIVRDLEHGQSLGSLFYLLGMDMPDSTTLVLQLRDQAQEVRLYLEEFGVKLNEMVEESIKTQVKYSELYWNEVPLLAKEQMYKNEDLYLWGVVESITIKLKDLFRTLYPYTLKWSVETLPAEAALQAYARFQNLMSLLEDAVMVLETLANRQPDHTFVMKYHARLGFSLEAAPIDVGRIVYEQLIEKSSSVVFTSATLGLPSEVSASSQLSAVEWSLGHQHIVPAKRFKRPLVLPPVFDYTSRAKVFLCDDVPALYNGQYVPTLLLRTRALITQLGGRSLLLFSSRQRFEQAIEYLLSSFKNQIPLFIQGMGHKVVENFKSSPAGILVGMESFGEGIDVPGDLLQFILIDKIPDIRMDLVIRDRRDFYEQNYGNEFLHYFLTIRANKLHQKLGRLLRTTSDYGGVIIADARIKQWKTNTRRDFAQLMKPYQLELGTIEQASDTILDFIQSHHQAK